MTLSAIVLTRNEKPNIEDCLKCLSWADEMLVVDSGSTDSTVTLAEKCGARVVMHPLTDFASQRNFVLSQAKGDWVLFIDADERVTPELAEEIKAVISHSSDVSCHSDLGAPPMAGQDPREESPNRSFGCCPQDDEKQGLSVYALPRHNYFFGRRLRFGDSQEDAPVRLFPRERATWAQPVHETVLSDLPVRRLNGPLLHYSTRDLTHYRQKVHDYVPLELRTMQERGERPALWKCFLIPTAKFLQLYFVKLGILDGIAGLQYAILSSCCYSFQKHWLYWRANSKPS